MIRTIHEAAAAIRANKITPVDLVEKCLANIDVWEPHVHAWVFVDRDGALAEAKRLTEELARGQDRGPLHGIPIGVKDIYDVFDWPTAAGSKLWANSIAREDAAVIKQLRQAGCIFLGKTVTTQWASFDPPVTRNPWNLDRTPGGSSSGSAAAVATGMCLAALGSQTGGSITRPAAYCGVAGCKPAYNQVSLQGIVPLAASMDHPGPIARCVRDLAILLQMMLAPAYMVGQTRVDYENSSVPAKPAVLRRLRGIFHDLAEPPVRIAMDEVCEKLCNAGAVVHEIPLSPTFSDVLLRHRVIMAVEAAQYHRTRLMKHPKDYEPKIRQLLEEGLACPAPEYADCKTHQERLRMEYFLLQHDIFITPATTSPAPDASTTGNPAFNSPWSYAGSPTISIPTGQFVDGLPLAIQLIGGRENTTDLFSAAAWCEKVLNAGPMTPPMPSKEPRTK